MSHWYIELANHLDNYYQVDLYRFSYKLLTFKVYTKMMNLHTDHLLHILLEFQEGTTEGRLILSFAIS